MQLVKFVFAIGEMFAFFGFGYALVMTVCLLFSNISTKEYQRLFDQGIRACFCGIIIMSLTLMYGVLK